MPRQVRRRPVGDTGLKKAERTQGAIQIVISIRDRKEGLPGMPCHPMRGLERGHEHHGVPILSTNSLLSISGWTSVF
jgi:hypothetical protein